MQKLSCSMNKNASQGQIHHSLRPFVLLATTWLLVRLPGSSAEQISSFTLSTTFNHVSPCSYITWGLNNRWAGWLSQCSVWLLAGLPGDWGSMLGRGERIFPLPSVSRHFLGLTQPPIQRVLGVLSPGLKLVRGVTLTTHPHLVPRLRMSRSYTSSSLKHLRGV
jgi:hypothetical protein